MVKIAKKMKFIRIICLISLSIVLNACSLGMSFKNSEVRSFKGVLLPDLSSEPILIEKVSIDLIKKENKKTPLNLPLSLVFLY